MNTSMAAARPTLSASCAAMATSIRSRKLRRMTRYSARRKVCSMRAPMGFQMAMIRVSAQSIMNCTICAMIMREV
ncbi:hypothetical protein SFUMM280S_09066 [Streptomyces fumanus]